MRRIHYCSGGFTRISVNSSKVPLSPASLPRVAGLFCGPPVQRCNGPAGTRGGLRDGHAIEAEMYLSRRSEMDSILKRQVTAQRRRDSSLRLLEQRRSRQQKDAAQITRAFMDERNREKFGPPEMVTVARKNGAGDAPELKTVRSEASRKLQNGHG
jgi:hypothetical protein